jgi:hypothetical protein
MAIFFSLATSAVIVVLVAAALITPAATLASPATMLAILLRSFALFTMLTSRRPLTILRLTLLPFTIVPAAPMPLGSTARLLLAFSVTRFGA